jgi:hypothetical protein
MKAISTIAPPPDHRARYAKKEPHPHEREHLDPPGMLIIRESVLTSFLLV